MPFFYTASIGAGAKFCKFTNSVVPPFLSAQFIILQYLKIVEIIEVYDYIRMQIPKVVTSGRYISRYN